jgi:hypothetical protein
MRMAFTPFLCCRADLDRNRRLCSHAMFDSYRLVCPAIEIVFSSSLLAYKRRDQTLPITIDGYMQNKIRP